MSIGAVLSLVTLLLQIAKGLFVKTPEEKAEDRIQDRAKMRAKKAIELHEAAKKFKAGDTSALERYISNYLK